MNTKNKSDKTDLVACAIFLKKKKYKYKVRPRLPRPTALPSERQGRATKVATFGRAAQSLALLSDSSEYTYKAVGRDSRSVTAAYRGR